MKFLRGKKIKVLPEWTMIFFTNSLGSVIKSHGFSYHCYADDTQLFPSFPPSATQVNKKISACLADISSWMARYHLKLNLDKTELLYILHRTSPLPELSVTIDGTTVTASRSARNLGVVLDDQLDFKEHVAAMSRSYRFLVYIIKRIRLYLTTYSTQLLIQAMVISRLDYCNSLLASLPACVIQPLQLIQNAIARLVFNLPNFSNVTPLLRSLNWLPVAAWIKFNSSSDSGLCCSQQDSPSLPTGHHSGLHTSSTTRICCHRPPCSSCKPCSCLSLVPTAELLHPRSPVVERSPHPHKNCSLLAHLPPQLEDSPLHSVPRLLFGSFLICCPFSYICP